MASTVTTTAGWKKSRDHEVLCPSGSRIVIRIPDLPALIEAGSIPQHLLDAALGVAGNPDTKPTLDLIKQQREFTDVLTSLTVVEPKLTESDIPEIPFEDKEFIVAIATRQRDLDAEGEHISGLSKSEKWRRFRGVGEFSSDVESL